MDDSENSRPPTNGEWFMPILIIGQPLIGIVMPFDWAITDGNIGRRHVCRASPPGLAIVIGPALLAFISFLLVGALMAGMSAAAQS